MAKRVFFSFHYDNDIHRAERIRNSWLTHADRESAGFFDSSIREKAKRTDDAALRRFIREGMRNTSVTAVLIGAETADRKWVKFEISESIDKGNGLIGVRIHRMQDLQKRTTIAGTNPFERRWTKGDHELDTWRVPVYDWVTDDGYNNLGTWIDGAHVVT